MNQHLKQLAVDAQIAVYVMASPDAREIEFLNLKPMASFSERESLMDRWPGRDLRPTGVIGRLPDGRVQMALKVPFGHEELAALLLAFTEHCEALQSVDDSVTWCEHLYALDSRELA